MGLFGLAYFSELIAHLLPAPAVHWIAKPLIVVALLLYYLSHAGENVSKVVVIALLLSLAGDVLLMLNSEIRDLFVAGLVAFLLAHVAYILGYRQHQSGKTDALHGVQRVRYSMPIVLAGAGLVIILLPHLGPLKIPVVIYALVLVVMVLSALYRFGKTTLASFWLVLGGALLFMTSDSILAINKFLSPLPMAGFWIMLTYGAAQWCITVGLLQHRR